MTAKSKVGCVTKMMIESLHMGHVELISVGFSEKKVVAHVSSGQ